MRYKDAFIKTSKGAREFDSVNATLLQKGSFIDQTMAGVYTFLPLGWRVLTKIEAIVREEMNKIGAELLMPALSPQEFWRTTGRLESLDVLFEARGGNDSSRKKNDATYVLNSTHEDVITPIAQTMKVSYKDLPFAVYQIQTKFRNEPRPKSGLLRGREFRMKDLYSFHANDDDRKIFYDNAKTVYATTFERLGLGQDTVVALASGGDFTKEYSHEFQTKCETGEDTIYYDEKSDTYYNKEVASDELKQTEGIKACEVGNIFPLGTRFPDAFGYTFTNEQGQAEPVHMASYGIGTSRVMGVLVEKFHDDHGIVWPVAVAPFTVYLANLHPNVPDVTSRAESAYQALTQAGIDVLYDDRPEAGAGQKLADADLLGIPWRAVISQKTGENLEIKQRGTETVEMLSAPDFITKLTS